MDESLGDFLDIEHFSVLGPIFFLGVDVGYHHQDGHDHEAYDEAGGEHLADGGAGYRAVYDHDDRRRNDRAEAAGDDEQAGHSVFAIAEADHIIVEHYADSYDGSRRGAGQCRKECRSQYESHRHAAAHIADDGVGEIDDAAGDAALGHDVAGQHEVGDRHDGGRFQAAEYALRDDAHRYDEVR